MRRGLWKAGLVVVLLSCSATAVAADGASAPLASATGAVIVDASAPNATVSTPTAAVPGTWSVSLESWSSPGDAPAVQLASLDSTTSDGKAGPAAHVMLSGVQLFGGELTLDNLDVVAKQPPSAARTVTAQLGTLQLDGTGVTAPALGAPPVPLADWGELSVGAALDDGSVAGVQVKLVADHDGLAAGSLIELGVVDVAKPPASGGGGGSGQSPPPAPTPTPTHRHHTHDRSKAGAHHRRHGRIDDRHPVHLPHLGSGVRADIVRAAAAQIGWPYVWGGESREEGGFDCSGLVDYAYMAAGHPLPGRPTAAVLWHLGVPITQADLRPGDLAFLGAKSGEPYHVALYAGNGMMIVASGRHEPIAEEPLDSAPWDGFARLWAPGGIRPVRPGHRAGRDARADAIAAARVQQDRPVRLVQRTSDPGPRPAQPQRHPTPPRRHPARVDTPVTLTDPRLRPAHARGTFPLPSA